MNRHFCDFFHALNQYWKLQFWVIVNNKLLNHSPHYNALNTISALEKKIIFFFVVYYSR